MVKCYSLSHGQSVKLCQSIPSMVSLHGQSATACHTKYVQPSWSKCYSLSYKVWSAVMVKVLQPVIPSMASLHGQSTTACHIKYRQPSWSKCYSPVIPSMTSWAKCYSLSYQVWSAVMVKILQPVIPSMVSLHGQSATALSYQV